MGEIKQKKSITFAISNAAIAQLVEHQLPKLRVASSSLVCRSYIMDTGICNNRFADVRIFVRPARARLTGQRYDKNRCRVMFFMREAQYRTGDAPLSVGEVQFFTGDAPLSVGDAQFSTGDAPLSIDDVQLSPGDAPLSVGEV